MVGIDYIAGGRGFGSVAERLLANRMDPNCLRPYIGRDGRSYISTKTKKRDPKTGQRILRPQMVANAATLTYDEWKTFDRSIIRAARKQLRFLGDLRDAGLTRTIPGGMGKTLLLQQSMTDAGNAQLDMDGLAEAQRDRVTYDLTGLPLPIAHADFSFSAREIETSRQDGTGIDTVMAEQETRKVLELLEKLHLGTLSTFTYGGYSLYGMTNYPNRLTTVLTNPTAAGWVPETTVNEVLGMIQALQDLQFNGPYGLYFSPAWNLYFGQDYAATYAGQTLRSRLGLIDDIQWMRKLQFLSGFQIILVQMDSDTIQTVQAMPLRAMQWDGFGGMQVNFKIMCIVVPNLRSNSDGHTGVNHGTAP